MRKLILSMNLSLDGFADHTVAIADDELHDYFSDQLESLDIELFGRETYLLMESYWPNAGNDPEASESTKRFAERFNAMPKVVFSKTLREAGWNNTRIVTGDAGDEVMRLKRLPGKNLAVGGIRLSRDLMRRGLVDEYLLLVHPVLAGTGRRLFDESTAGLKLKLRDTRTFASGVVVLHYTAG